MKKQEEANLEAVKAPWTPLRVRCVGTISEVVQGGGGKLSTAGGDQGDNRKPSGQG